MTPPDLDRIKILLIDDEVHIRTIIRQIINRLGIRNVFESAEGGDGFMQTLRTKPSIVFCDIHMKPVDGLHYLAKLRSTKVPGVRETPVIFLTSNSQEQTIFLAKDLKVNGYMVKPVSVNDVKKNIERVLKMRFDMV